VLCAALCTSQTGGVGIRVQYNDQDTLLTPEQVVAMMLTKVCDIARAANSDLAVVEAVVGIPGWYTDSMRRAMLVSSSSYCCCNYYLLSSASSECHSDNAGAPCANSRLPCYRCSVPCISLAVAFVGTANATAPSVYSLALRALIRQLV
jgi:Hsp70 protein